jgi:hypothetical protein
MRKFIRASVLVLALAIPAFAGDIPYGVTGDIPNNATGDMQNGVISTLPPAGSTATEAFLTLLQSLLALF